MTKQPVYSAIYNNTELLDRLFLNFSRHLTQDILLINISQQRLYYLHHKTLQTSYTISSALNGCGNQNGSGKTPLGAHCIQEKVGEGAVIGSIFKGRIGTGKIATILTSESARSQDDNITSRILWLNGLEPGYNHGGDVDSHQRYIYIHGTDEEGRIGQPVSHGCIRMANQDIINVFEQIQTGTFVYIIER